MAATDWRKKLWPASYGGFQFYFEKDKEIGGRDIIVHEFPHRDDPFNEDLGQLARKFEGTAYLASDQVDSDAVTFTEMLCQPGPGTLVVPIRGPVQVRCTDVERTSERDKAGYIAFEVKFVREGKAQSTNTVAGARQTAFNSADALTSAIALQFNASSVTQGQPNYVVAAAVSGVQAAAAAFDIVRTSNAVDPAVSAPTALALRQIVLSAPAMVTSDDPSVDPDAVTVLLMNTPPVAAASTFDGLPQAQTAAALIGSARQLAFGMDAAAACGAMLEVALGNLPIGAAPSYLSPGAESAAENVAITTDLARLAAITAWSDAICRMTFTNRPAAVTMRADVAERLDLELNSASEYGAQGYDLSVAVQNLRGSLIAYLTKLITALPPIVTVSSADTMPALWWAWRLYSSPERECDLVLRNGVPDPLHMPVSFQALAPSYPVPSSLPTVWPAP